MRNRMRVGALVLALAVVAGGLEGCNAGELIKTAPTPEDKADNLARVYAEYQEAAANLVENPAISAREKHAIRVANRVAAPAANALLDASGEYRKAKKAIDDIRAAGGNPDAIALRSLDIALEALKGIIAANEQPILRFKKLASKGA